MQLVIEKTAYLVAMVHALICFVPYRFITGFILITVRVTTPPWPEAHNTAADYTTFHGYHNKSYYSLTLPAVPKNCPTPMGVAGKLRLHCKSKLWIFPSYQYQYERKLIIATKN